MSAQAARTQVTVVKFGIRPICSIWSKISTPFSGKSFDANPLIMEFHEMISRSSNFSNSFCAVLTLLQLKYKLIREFTTAVSVSRCNFNNRPWAISPSSKDPNPEKHFNTQENVYELGTAPNSSIL
uniref:Uncharacterized protein n=1 Tax=Opuntia streptacantha TaxID=393608 RepID=A0A7C8YHP3_OPUST